jgi:heavy metal sensor kinase
MNTQSIRFRLAAWHSVLFAAVFAVLGSLLYFTVRQYLDDTLLETQARRARQIAGTLLANAPQTGEEFVVHQIESLYAPELGDRFIRVTRANGSILYESGPPNDQSFDPSTVPPAKPVGSAEFSRLQDLGDGRHMLIAAFRATTAKGSPYLVEVGTSAEPVDRFALHLLTLLALGIPLVAAVAATGGYLLVGKALKPVEEIAVKAEMITQHSLGERLPVASTGDELELLSTSLNRMITRLDAAFSNSKRFIADASHELRTPLTVIQGELEHLASDAHLPADLRDRIGSTLEEVERLGKIVQKLFALSRLDAGEAQEEWIRLDLAALVSSTSDQMLLLGEDKNVKVTREIDHPVYVMGDRARLKQVAVNLIDNAVKYTPPGGSVHLKVLEKAGRGIFEITDTGIGIPAGALPLVFERFYRVNRDRSSVDDGAGLGLAIVKSICVAHGGMVEVESALGAGSRFLVILPLAGDKEQPQGDEV